MRSRRWGAKKLGHSTGRTVPARPHIRRTGRFKKVPLCTTRSVQRLSEGVLRLLICWLVGEARCWPFRTMINASPEQNGFCTKNPSSSLEPHRSTDLRALGPTASAAAAAAGSWLCCRIHPGRIVEANRGTYRIKYDIPSNYNICHTTSGLASSQGSPNEQMNTKQFPTERLRGNVRGNLPTQLTRTTETQYLLSDSSHLQSEALSDYRSRERD